ncbi:MAG TPA: NAD(P)/FAD-dependent oxidoreductase [Rhodanobacter sp.]|jgi:flavin-dependent dehydrogenase|nr:NAD(P)/FAD-dependent oxidoreductase [Rhodanobacter sp.]
MAEQDSSHAGAAASTHAMRECDVLIIGGGPAGSTAGALLAQRGHRITLLEKARHPRFHIGESLLPANLPLLDKLGVADAVRAMAMEKWGAEFVSPWHAQRSQTFEFADAWNKSMPQSYEVRRSGFDEILIRNTARQGAEVIEGCRATHVAFDPDHRGATIEARHDDGRSDTWRARFVLDASGRDTFLGKKFGTRRRNPRHNSSALYAHFSGARRHPGRAAGNITVFWFEHGWFWFIPLADGATSVGAVVWPHYLKTRSKPLEDFFHDTIALCPALGARLHDAARITPVEATGNFSYACDQTHGANYLLLGDAFSFIDPVFSSGVMLAMQGGFCAADAVDTCLREPQRARTALKRFDRQVRHGPRAFSWFIYRITTPTMRDLFMGPRNVLRVREALLSMLAGDIFGTTPIWTSLFVLKGIYYAACMLHPRRNWQALRQRRANIRAPQAVEAVARPGTR